MTNKITLSQDGSHTLISEKFGVSYHSKYGAIEESNTVFIDACLRYLAEEKSQKTISIFEMGLGTGLNALLTYQYAIKHGVNVFYTAVEAYPITIEQAAELNYPTLLDLDASILHQIHGASSGEAIDLAPEFTITKIIGKLQDVSIVDQIDGIYYDAFAPNSQPELWTEETMTQLHGMLVEGGIITTYCAKGSFKRALKAAGFEVQGLPGPTGKREMTRGVK